MLSVSSASEKEHCLFVPLCLNKKLCDSVSLCLIEWSAHIHVDVAYKGLMVVIDIRIGQSFFTMFRLFSIFIEELVDFIQ